MAFTKITASGIGSTETVTLDGLSVINDGSFGGNVSVAGTLTYEDVTNIDSVGLITARAGVVVGSGITLSKDGDIFATGITTVSGNVKVGTGITLSPDGDGFFTGVVTATTFKGDGSQLSNVTSTTINNNADNRLITGSGTANTLEAEANLTFDATNFTTKASSSATSANAGGSGLKIQNTDNTNNNQNFLGFFDSTGTSSAAIIAQHENHSSTTGNLQFGTRNAGTYAERVRIASDGKVTIKTASNATSRLLFENTGSVRTNYIGLFDDDDRIVIAADDDAQGSNSSIHFKVDGTEKMIVSSDQIDINDRLDVIHNGGGNYIAQFENTNTTTPYGTFCNSPTGAAAGYPIISVNQTGASPATKFRVDSGTGRIYINTDTLFSSEYQASLYITSTGGIVFRPDGTSTRKPLAFQNNSGTEVGSISNSTGSTSFNTSSDYRLKENITAISDGITRLKTLKPSRFNFKTDKDTTVDGFIAHEVTAVPEAITGTKDEVNSDNNPVYQAIDQSKLVPLLTAALQEAVTKIEALEARVATLEGS